MVYGEMLFQIGVGLLIAAAVGTIVVLILYFHRRKKLRKQLEAEYGKQASRKGA